MKLTKKHLDHWLKATQPYLSKSSIEEIVRNAKNIRLEKGSICFSLEVKLPPGADKWVGSIGGAV